MNHAGISDEQLSAFVDGELDDATADAVRRAIDGEPALAARLALLRADNERLAAVYRPLLDRPLPEAWIRRSAAGRPAAPAWPRAAAAMAVAVAVVVAGWLVYAHFAAKPGDALIAEALAARDGKRPAEQTIDAASLASPAAGDDIAAGNLSAPVKVPDLRRAGFDLAAIVIYPDQAPRHAVQLRYRDRSGRLFTVYLTHPDGPDGFDMRRLGHLSVCIWRTGELSAVMTGEMSTDEMLRIASLTYADLNF
jgi:anti-sigma factor RsiW